MSGSSVYHYHSDIGDSHRAPLKKNKNKNTKMEAKTQSCLIYFGIEFRVSEHNSGIFVLTLMTKQSILVLRENIHLVVFLYL